ncbi:response regulator transcription factor [Streptomyces sp. V4-01]|uniref:Response regulator transcription factor n=1 Tax=Actinacidiphila polyblastidii TaxID=3110430 RepID=A0ABU7PKD9_9ACTN|nr:response regulator transcription factor [Streptomyces sp. V4-01]
MSDAIRIAIVDDHPLTRRGVESILREQPDFEVVGSCDDPGVLPAPARFDVLVLDLYLGTDEPSLDVVGQWAEQVKVLVVSASGRAADVVACIRRGASGYLTKSAGTAMFASAVRTVATGGFALSPQLADILSGELARERRMRGGRPPAAALPASTDRPELSPREEEVLGHIANGYTHAQIATRMKLGKSTVDTYVERIRHKLQAGNKAELTRLAIERETAERTPPTDPRATR